MLIVVGKNICRDPSTGVCKVTKGLIDDDQRGFRAVKGFIDQIFTLKQIGKEAWENKRTVYVGFMDLEKAYDRVNREAL